MAKMDAFEYFIVDKFKTRLNTRLFRHIISFPTLLLMSRAVCLELGCGKGDMAYRLINKILPVEYFATDYDKNQLFNAEKYLIAKNNGSVPNTVQFRTADALKLPFSNYSFDIVFAFSVLHHTENHFWLYRNIPRALSEVNRVLKPHGVFVYEEYVHHNKIRKQLNDLGFKILYRQKLWFFGELVIAAKSSA